MNEYPSVSILIYAVSKKTWTEPDHLSIYKKLQYINCYEKLMSQIKKANLILANSEEFSGQLWHVNTLLDRKALIFFKVPV